MADELFERSQCSICDATAQGNEEVQNCSMGLERYEMTSSDAFDGSVFQLHRSSKDSFLHFEGALGQEKPTVEATPVLNGAARSRYETMTGLSFLLEDFMLGTVAHTEALIDYRNGIEKLVQYVGILRKIIGESWGGFSDCRFEAWYYTYYTGLLEHEARELRMLHLQWLVLFAMFNAYGHSTILWDLPPSDVYTLFVGWFQMDTSGEAVAESIPVDTNVFQRQLFNRDKTSFVTTIRVYPIVRTHCSEFIEGYGEGSGDTDAESKMISFNVACRVIIKEICSGFAYFLDRIRNEKAQTQRTKEYDHKAYNYVLFSKVKSSFENFEQKTSDLDFFSKLKDSMHRGCEYLKNSKSYVPLSRDHCALAKRLTIPVENPLVQTVILSGKQIVQSYADRESALMSRNAGMEASSAARTDHEKAGENKRLPYVYEVFK